MREQVQAIYYNNKLFKAKVVFKATDCYILNILSVYQHFMAIMY